MCGLVGVLQEFGSPLPCTKIMRELLFTGAVRGVDGTGIFNVDRNGDVSSYKKALAGPDFIQLDKARKMLTDANTAFASVGHNRATTHGGNSDGACHPFTHGKITLVHNGVITNFRSLFKSEGFTVDSEAIAWSMNEIGEAETLEKLDGSYSLVWYNSEERVIKMARNEERPMHFMYEKGRTGLIFASEPQMLRWITERNAKAEEKHYWTQPETIYTFREANLKEYGSEKFKVYKFRSSFHNNSTSDLDKKREEIMKKHKLTSGKEIRCVVEALTRNNSTYASVWGDLTCKMLGKKNKGLVVKVNAKLSDWAVGDEISCTVTNVYLSIGEPPILWCREPKRVIAKGRNVIPMGAFSTLKDIEGLEEDMKAERLAELMPEKVSKVLLHQILDKKDFEVFAEEGCYTCGKELKFEELDSIVWSSYNEPICKDCDSILSGRLTHGTH